MSDEIFDVVDERDEVVDQRTRNEVHRLGLRHRAVHVLVFNAQGQVFIQKRSMSKDCHPGTWDSSASGHVERGESYDACAVRELREELGWAAGTPLVRLFKVEAGPKTGQEFVWVYRIEAEGPFVLHPEEISEGRWQEPGQVDRWVSERPEDFAPGFVLIWNRWRGRRG